MKDLYCQPDDLTDAAEEEVLVQLAAPEDVDPERKSLGDTVITENIRAQIRQAKTEIETTLSNRFDQLPVPFVDQGPLSGTVDVTAYDDAVTGNNTSFSSELAAGEGLGVVHGPGGEEEVRWQFVESVGSDTALTLSDLWRGEDRTGADVRRGTVHEALKYFNVWLAMSYLWRRKPHLDIPGSHAEGINRARKRLKNISRAQLNFPGVEHAESFRVSTPDSRRVDVTDTTWDWDRTR